ncbi:MAG: hypothetical protein IJJ82_07060 [Clostridia bacterium]|nr:hypothetical protein [Clostridia bacterium]
MTKSDVRIVTSIKGLEKLKEYINNYIKEHSYNRELTNILDNPDLKYESNRQCYLGWNNYNWNEYSNENVELVMNGLFELADNNYSYRFYRLGEEKDEYEEYSYTSTLEGEEDLEYPNITRQFDDRYVCDVLHREKQNADLSKEDFDYE